MRVPNGVVVDSHWTHGFGRRLHTGHALPYSRGVRLLHGHEPRFHLYSGKAVTPWTVHCFSCTVNYTSNMREVCNQSTAFLMIGMGEVGFRKKALRIYC